MDTEMSNSERGQAMKTTIEQMLRTACENSHGYFDATPGTDVAGGLDCTESAIKTMLRRGYLKKVGSGLVLTHAGYNAA